MKKGLSIISAIIAIIAFVGSMNITFVTNGYSTVPKYVAIFTLWILPIIGLILGFIGKKKFFKYVGIYGNSLTLLITLVYPLVMSFFWNEP
ncbi:hypothetical protein [Priestia endophytica]|uniref:hypothetical protein n=1 Tax=Priestia endophytica TaxID=135735 RepID=UPI000DCA8E1B|nr:hypothetical protein [Priestia endophytica]RAS77471.1 hypothetical protein A4R27_18690 [Priestia endophytica]RAS90820.1 hypothetical protein A3863_07495 [Priestia endophytica]